MNTTKELIDLIELKQINNHNFEGKSISVGSANVFGGQVLAQALNAASRTVPEDRVCHSIHAYFILRGDLEKPIHYRVQRVRDGGSFTTRYVTAEQDDKFIFVLAGSFQIREKGYEFQGKMPVVPGPESVLSLAEIYEQTKNFLPEKLKRFLSKERPVTFKPTVLPDLLGKSDLPPNQNIWFRFNEVSDNLGIQHFQEVLAYASDYNLLPTALHPHASKANPANTMLASLDHAMWFHREPEKFSDWFLYNIDVQSNSNARGLVTGKIFSQDGKLIASVAQEGLIREAIKKG